MKNIGILFWVVLLVACSANPAPASTPAVRTPVASVAPSAIASPAASPATAGEPCVVMRDQVPTAVGRTNVGYINAQPEKVSFKLDGPWDFTTGPTSDTMERKFVDVSAAKDAGQFQSANLAVRVTSTLFETGGEQFEFFNAAGDSERALGVSFSWNDQSTVYDPPYRDFVFPIKAGDTWRDTYRLKNSDGVMLTQATYEALACGTLTVPAGTFARTMLVRSTLRGVTEQGHPWGLFTYYWLSPGVGESVWVTSQVNEQSRLFSTASNFYRLKETK